MERKHRDFESNSGKNQKKSDGKNLIPLNRWRRDSDLIEGKPARDPVDKADSVEEKRRRESAHDEILGSRLQGFLAFLEIGRQDVQGNGEPFNGDE